MNPINGELLELFRAERQRERDACLFDVLAEPDDEPTLSWEERQAVQTAKRNIIERMRRRS